MEKTIKITGNAKLSTTPDAIRFEISSNKTFKDYQETLKNSTLQNKQLKSAIKKAGLNSKDLKTSHFSINVEYSSYQDENNVWKNKFEGYRYIHNLYICFPNDSKQLSALLNELSKSDLDIEFNIVHTVLDQEKYKDQLLKQAIKDASYKAKVLADASKTRLGEIINIDYSFRNITFETRPMSKVTLADNNIAYGLDINADDITIEDNVTIVWSLL